MGFGRVLGVYIERRHYRRPLIAGLIVGVLAGAALGYYLFLSTNPGPFGTIVLVFLSFMFGVVAGAVTAFLFFYLQIYRMTKLAVGGTCPSCGNRLPAKAAFCPFCGSSVER